MMASLADSSFRQYDVYLKRWFYYCNENGYDLYNASVPQIIYFLTKLYEEGSQYGTLNSCRSALALIISSNLGADDRIRRFFKGIFRLRPPLPKYSVTWDTSIVINYVSLLYPNESLHLDKISKKLATLLALLTAHRVQTFSKINIKNIETFPSKIIIKIPDFLKTTRIGCMQPILVLPFFEQQPEICPGKALLAYLEKTRLLRKDVDSLFISLKKPYRAVGPQTLSRWIKETLGDSGIDVTIFTAHSTRHAATSAAHNLGINLDLIRKTAGWSGSSNTFYQFYNRTISNVNTIEDDSFARTIVSRTLNQ
ncbi:hypothetical protein HF086_008621 [Spodoptera exigua]|uniref:Tyr recombinase domain-containing protein n=1 Tax=Spodoptera exigua TaxID=7107 RepID=A0A922M712_SPOEX|nr:hypothetical protein HF086_008621 [Spodoptera exigua]